MSSILHIIPKITFGGGLSNILAELQFLPAEMRPEQVYCVVLEPSYQAHLARLALKLRVRLIISPDDEELKSLLGKADLVVIQYWNTPGFFTFFQKLADWKLSNRFVMHSRIVGNTPPQCIPPGLIKAFHSILLTNPKLKSEFSDIGVSMTTIWGIGLHAPPTQLQESRPPTNCLKLIHAGTINPFKLHPKFIELHEGLKIPFQLDVFGVENQSLVYEGRLPIHLHPFETNVWERYSEYHLLSYPQNPLSYGSSDLVIQEAMWRGLPPILIKGTGLDAFLVHQKNCLLANDENDFVYWLEWTFSHWEEMEELRQSCFVYAQQEFNPWMQSKKVFDVYSEVLNQEPRKFIFDFNRVEDFYLAHLGLYLQELYRTTPDPQVKSYALHCEGGLIHYLKHFENSKTLQNLLKNWY